MQKSLKKNAVVVQGSGMTIDDLVDVARRGVHAVLSSDESILREVRASQQCVLDAIERGIPMYGITSGFGGMAHVQIAREELEALQTNLPWFLKAGAGDLLPAADVRSTMLLRANALMRGASGIRLELIDRLIIFLNAGVTPQVRCLGSIGASGDLVPLAAIAGAIAGLGDAFLVDFQGETMGARAALYRLGLEPLTLAPKEGLALVNGTSAMSGIAAGCLYDARQLLALTLAAHALALQGLGASLHPFHAFIHDHKPHPGQRFAASRMLALLYGSTLIHDELDLGTKHGGGKMIQDRYSVRCLPQFLGPIIDGLATITGQVELEMNSATDNPLIDAQEGVSYHSGNFLGQYVAVGMDQFRYYLGLLAKHLDVQIALLVEPAFNGGLPGSLVGNPEKKVNMGLKGLQISGNSIMPLITHLGTPLADRFPTHAEQFNQNINSQGFGSANLARQSVELFEQYLAVALLFGVQSVELRTRKQTDQCDARACLSPATFPLYEALREIVGRPPDSKQPLVFNDDEQSLDVFIAAIVADIRGGGKLAKSMRPLLDHVRAHRPDKNKS